MEQLTSIDKAIDVLFHLHAEPTACGVTAVGKALGLPKSSTHRLLAALARRGLVERDDTGQYRPGIALVALGLGVLDRDPVVVAARPVLEAEAQAHDETMFLTAARAGRIVVLDKVEGANVLRVSPQVGSEVPVHATAAGKLYAAFAPDRIALPTGKLKRFTKNTLGREAFDHEVAVTRRRGWAANLEEWQSGMAVVAAPLLVSGRMEGVVTLAAPAVRLPAERVAQAGARLIGAARRIRERLEGKVS
jgi:IclR family acetate operon transcriptional repressor